MHSSSHFVEKRDLSERDICTKLITPAILQAGWKQEQFREEVKLTPGRVVVRGKVAQRAKRRSFRIARTTTATTIGPAERHSLAVRGWLGDSARALELLDTSPSLCRLSFLSCNLRNKSSHEI